MINIQRTIQKELIHSAASYPVVTVIGPRQSGKTTLVKATFPSKAYVNLEAPDIRSFAETDPRRFLEQYPDGAILDEIQRVPSLLSYIQTIVDEREDLGIFILTGSHQLSLQQEVSQSLAGRTSLLHLMPLSLQELKQAGWVHELDEQLQYGFYPRIYKYDLEPQRFYRDYVQTYVERDVKMLVNIKDLSQFQRLLSLCATRIGQTIDYTQLGNELGISRHTVKEWISLLKASFLINTLPPYFENLGKRIIKSEKLYFNDVGLACYLLGIREPTQVVHHPLRGALFENMVVSEINKLLLNRGEETRLYFYRDSNQLEVDLIFQYGLHLMIIEIKSSKTFHSSFLKGLETFTNMAKQHKTRGYIVYGGEHQQQVSDYHVINYLNMNDIIDVS